MNPIHHCLRIALGPMPNLGSTRPLSNFVECHKPFSRAWMTSLERNLPEGLSALMPVGSFNSQHGSL